MENVVLARFGDRIRAEEAMSGLRALADDGQVAVHTAVLVERQPDGRLALVDEGAQRDFEGTLAGGAVGAILGTLAGPAGLLLGGTAGLLVGSLADAGALRQGRLMAGEVSGSVPPGTAAVVADVDEASPEVVDRMVDELGGAVMRWPRAEVQAELRKDTTRQS